MIYNVCEYFYINKKIKTLHSTCTNDPLASSAQTQLSGSEHVQTIKLHKYYIMQFSNKI